MPQTGLWDAGTTALRMSWYLDCSSVNLPENIPVRSWSGDKCIWNFSGLYRKLGAEHVRGYPGWRQHVELCWPHTAQRSIPESVSAWALQMWQLSLRFVVCKPMSTRCPPQPQVCKINWKAAWKQTDLLIDLTVYFIYSLQEGNKNDFPRLSSLKFSTMFTVNNVKWI